MKKSLLTAYLVIIHVLLGVACITSDFLPRIAAALHLTAPPPSEAELMMNMMRTVHSHVDDTVPEGATLFLGDSITMFFATSSLAAHTVNYGIGWQRSDQLIESMDRYQSMNRAARVVVTIGTNDLLQHRSHGIESRYRAILAKIPAHASIIMSSIPPLGSSLFRDLGIAVDDVRRVIASAQTVCEADHRCRFVNAYEALTVQGHPAPGVLMADDIHLTPQGYARWFTAMRPAMAVQPASPELSRTGN
jgi:lysophospholipase L1-like esterase